ncbi:MAG: NACHT domain-containing protein, partial [bacterium]|nr:NACHT domain-containing protein [bacterium]
MTRTLRSVATGLYTLGLTALTLRLAAQQQPAPDGFWKQYGDKILVAVVTAVIVLTLSETIKALLKRLGARIERTLQSFGWRFRKRYLQALIDEHRWLKLIGVYSRADLHPPRLREVYVSLRLAAGGPEAGPRFTWHELFSATEKRLVILGPPGAGKSTLIDYLILVFTGHVASTLRDRLRRPLPLFGQLRKLGSEGGPATVIELLRTSTLKRVPADFPERQLRGGNAIVLLDGLDEVLDEDRHRQVVAEIRQLVHEYPDNWFVVTCRVAGWRHQLEDFRTYELQEPTDDDVRRFIGAWYREVLRTQKVNLLGAKPEAGKLQEAEKQAFVEAGERADSLWRALSGNESLLRIARTPLLLSLITLVHYHRVTDLPQGRAKLYEQCLEILLELWDRQDKRLQVSGSSWKGKLLVLREMAFYYLHEDLLEADLPSLEAVVGPLLPKLKEETTARALIEQIWKRSGILVEVALGRYGFAHRALQDYLAAAHVEEHELDDLLLKHSDEERWREVILIAVGLVPERRAQRLLGSFMSEGSADASALEMAVLGLAEDVQVGDDLRAAIRRQLLERLAGEESASAFGRLAGALMVADLEAARTWIAEALRGHDPGLRERLLQLLPDLGKEHAGPLVPLLVRLVGAVDEDLRVRSQA